MATGEPLTQEEIEQILARLPALTPEPGDQTDFHLPGEPMPPPRPGETIQEAFPPPPEPVQPAPVETGPLQVLRFSPEGEIPIAPFFSVTFNQPMVPLVRLSKTWRRPGAGPDRPAPARHLALAGHPHPDLPIRFRADRPPAQGDRIPGHRPGRDQSATGGVLAEPVRWTFSTPPPRSSPPTRERHPQPLDPIFFIAFDQRIDPAAVLRDDPGDRRQCSRSPGAGQPKPRSKPDDKWPEHW